MRSSIPGTNGKAAVLLVVVVVAAASFVSCRGASVAGFGAVSLSVTIPDYFEYSSDSASSRNGGTQPRLIDPSTFFIEVNVSADDIDTISQFFSLDSSNYASNGLWTIFCEVKNIPAGPDRLITITTRDIGGNALTTGTVLMDLASREENTLDLTLTPAEASEVAVGDVIAGTADYGKMSFHSVSFPSTGLFRITLTSSYDVDLYLFNSDGSLYSADYVQRGTPTDEEEVLDITEGGTSFFIGVFGFDKNGSASYSISVENADPPVTVPVFKTGQTTDAYLAGDDGHLEKGRVWPSPRFTDNGDGTITDNMTGLMWEAAPDTNGRLWEDALAYANGSAVGDYNDWRLPNVEELESLCNYNLAWGNPLNQADWLASEGFVNITAVEYWTSTTQVSVPGNAYTMNLFFTRVDTGDKAVSTDQVITVRGESLVLPKTGQTASYTSTDGEDGDIQAGLPWPSPRFTDNGDNTVTDNLTGLMWEQSPSINPLNLSDCISYADTFGAGGHMDWRLPNMRELLTLVNYSENDFSVWLNTSGFSDVTSGYYWTSTRYLNDPVNSGFLLRKSTLPHGWYSGVTGGYYCWPVRGGE